MKRALLVARRRRSWPPRAAGATTTAPIPTRPTVAASDDVDTGDCTVVDMAVSSEKIALLEELADSFNGTEVGGRCVVVRPRSVASGLAATLIPQGWPDPDVNGEPPVIWSPAASAWAGHRQRPCRAGAGPGRHAVPADAARDRDAAADGRGARLAAGAARASPTC